MATLEDNKKWFKEAKFGMMVHWGLYSILGGEHRGVRPIGVAEWIRSTRKIPKEEYNKLASIFNPIYFNAEDWVLTAKQAGMQYIVVTAKHHDGFCLYKSSYDDFNMVDGTPFGRDIIGEIAEACRKHQIKLGLYYSQEMDWNEPNAGGFEPDDPFKFNPIHPGWANTWDYPDNSKKNFKKYFYGKVMPQVRELLTKYGEICLIWFDNPVMIPSEMSRELNELVKSLQPGCLINSRVGNDMGDYRSMGDNEIPDEYMEELLVETPATMNSSWGFKYYDNDWKTADEILRIKEHLNSRGVNYLLNVGPDHLGRIPAPCVDILREVGNRDKGLSKE